MQIYFIRHAQSNNNELYDRTGKNEGRNEDPELSTIGKIQAKLLSEYLVNHFKEKLGTNNNDPLNRSGFNFDTFLTSPMIRAVETGWQCTRLMGVKLRLCVDLHEGGGIFLENSNKELIGLPGKPKTYFLKRYPGILLDEKMTDAGWWNQPFEPQEIRKARAKRIWELIFKECNDSSRIVMFSHFGFFNYFLSALLDYKWSEMVKFKLNNVGISRIDVNADRTLKEIVYINKVDFLPAELIT